MRVRWKLNDSDLIFDGTVIDQTKYKYTVIPDHNKEKVENWDKKCCEIIFDLEDQKIKERNENKD